MSLLVLVADTVTGKIRGFDQEFVTRVRSANGFGHLGGTVTSVSVVTANGISGTVANAATTPAITLDASLAINSAVAVAVADVDADLAAAIAALTEDIAEAIQSGRWEPVTNGDPNSPKFAFDNTGDVVMGFVSD